MSELSPEYSPQEHEQKKEEVSSPSQEVSQPQESRIQQTVDGIYAAVQERGTNVTTSEGRQYQYLPLPDTSIAIHPAIESDDGIRAERISLTDTLTTEEGQRIASGNNVQLSRDNYAIGGLEERYVNPSTTNPERLVIFGGQLATLDEATRTGIETYLTQKQQELQQAFPSSPASGQTQR